MKPNRHLAVLPTVRNSGSTLYEHLAGRRLTHSPRVLVQGATTASPERHSYPSPIFFVVQQAPRPAPGGPRTFARGHLSRSFVRQNATAARKHCQR
jgi:hypothetical protein